MNILKITILFISFFALNVNAQNDMDAAKILQDISAKYNKYNSAKIEVKLTVDIPEQKDNIVKNATAWIKGDKFKIEFDDKILMSNTETQWMFLKEENELQISDYDESAMIFLPSKILNIYSDKYVYRVKEAYKNSKGELIKKIELTPLNKEMEIFKIVVSINTNTMEVLETRMFEKSGFKYSYKILNLKPNVDLKDTFFKFIPSEYNLEEDDITDLR